MKTLVPKSAKFILSLFLNNEFNRHRLYEFDEIFESILKKSGYNKAALWYWTQTLKSFPKLLLNSIYWGVTMLKNYLITAYRSLKKSKIYTFINIFGLSVGMTCSILIFAYVGDELNYDTFHKNADQVYRLTNNNTLAMSGLLGPIAKEANSEVIDYTRIYASKIYTGDVLFTYQDKGFYVTDFAMADPSIFRIFSFNFIQGNPNTVLNNKGSVVITNEIAEKFFGNDNPIGKLLTYENEFNFTVTGVIEKLPDNSHFNFDCIISLENYETITDSPGELESFMNWAYVTYLLVTPNADINKLKTNTDQLIYERSKQERIPNVGLQLLTDIHLTSSLRDELKVNGNINNVYVFIAIAILVLIIASVNFVNLTTARSTNRAKEVGVRKVIGANKNMLINQFLTESTLMSIAALILSLLLLILILPFFNDISGKSMEFSSLISPVLLLTYFGGAIFIGILAGSFPAFVMSSYKPAAVLKSNMKSKKEARFSFRNILVVIQFTIAITLIICTIVVYNQTKFMQNADLGLNKEKMVIIPMGKSETSISKVEILENQIQRLDGVVNVTASSRTPGHRPWGRGIEILDDSTTKYDKFTIFALWVDYNFTDTYKIQLLAGRTFSKEFATDLTSAFIINETTLKKLGWTNPEEAIGHRIDCDFKVGEIIGVVKDFHFQSLHTEIIPMVMHIQPDRFYTMSVNIKPNNTASTLNAIENIWNNIIPNRPFEYFFLEDDLSQQYKADTNVGKLITYFSILSLFITCLGLLGLASYAAEQKKKEIGIRKVLGASTGLILTQLMKRFVALTVLGNIVAWPVAYFAMTKWLGNFAYKTSLTVWPFVISALLALLIAVVSVGYQSIKAALANPINSIKYE